MSIDSARFTRALCFPVAIWDSDGGSTGCDFEMAAANSRRRGERPRPTPERALYRPRSGSTKAFARRRDVRARPSVVLSRRRAFPVAIWDSEGWPLGRESPPGLEPRMELIGRSDLLAHASVCLER